MVVYCCYTVIWQANIKSVSYVSTIRLFQKLVPNPSLVVDGVSRFDFGQGLVGRIVFFIQKIPTMWYEMKVQTMGRKCHSCRVQSQEYTNTNVQNVLKSKQPSLEQMQNWASTPQNYRNRQNTQQTVTDMKQETETDNYWTKHTEQMQNKTQSKTCPWTPIQKSQNPNTRQRPTY